MSRQFPQKVKRSGPASHDSRLSRRHHHQYRHTSSQRGIKYIQTDTLENDILSDQIDVLGTGIEKEKDEEEEEEHPDLLACRPCELVFAQAWGLKDHQIRGCPVDEPPARRCKREDDGVEGTYGYKLECYLKDLPATVCCAEQLPARVENRSQSFVVNTTLAIEKEYTGWYFISQKKNPQNYPIRSDEHRKRITVASDTC